jgi:hypothetical protein
MILQHLAALRDEFASEAGQGWPPISEQALARVLRDIRKCFLLCS